MDVFELQRVLNQDPLTAVDVSGPGSKGNETYYFGEKTKNAVIAFQNKYADDVLLPQGIAFGTGFVGASTRSKLNSLISMSASADTTTPPAFVPVSKKTQNPNNFSSFNFFEDNDKSVQLVFISKNYGKYGDTIEFTGNNFSLTDNQIYFGSKVVSGVKALNKNKILFTIPDSISPGVYDVEIGNSAGKSESNSYFVVTGNSNTPAPKIISITPTVLSLGDTVTIVGENFTPTNNQIRTSLGVSENVNSSDGKTLKFTITAPSDLEIEKVFNADDKFELPVYVYVVNTNGVSGSLNPGIITLKRI